VASGGAFAGVPRFRARGLDFERSLYQKVTRATAKHPRAARAAKRVYDAAARQGSSGEVARATGCTESTTNSMGILLTSRCNSLAASRRQNDGGGKESKAAAARVSGRRRRTGLGRLGMDWGGPGVAARFK
jgi:hypothetical protein